MPREPKPLEATVELSAVAWAKAHGVLTRKLKWIGRRKAPDRIFAPGRSVFIEFKRIDEDPDEGQAREIKRMRASGLEVHVVRTMSEFLEIMRRRNGEKDERQTRRRA